MDNWQAAQNWVVFLTVVGGVAWYYYPTQKHNHRPLPPGGSRAEAKKPVRKHTAAEKTAAISSTISADATEEIKPAQTGAKKRKANTQAPTQTPAAHANEPADAEIDDSTRHFAEQMMRAKEGTSLKMLDTKQNRVKTVKPKNNTPLLSSGSSQADEEEGSPAVSLAARTSGIDDMLEPEVPGPNALRITAPTKPVKEKVHAPKKQEAVETKKQRQNRQKREAAKAEREEAEKQQKVRQEAQRRAARIARGEPAKNGIPVTPAPIDSVWAERNAVRDVQTPVVISSEGQSQLLDTFDVESNSSSNAEMSTAATSTTDHAPTENVSGDDDLQKAINESSLDSGWNHVASKKQHKKKAQQDGDSTPVPHPVRNSESKAKPAAKPTGFLALSDDAE